ncbi:hypothetical protein N9L19_00885 [bacterium]|nr:hypothetical protein [bacterium]
MIHLILSGESMAISSDDYPCLLNNALENIPDEEMPNMAGNAFHLVSYGQFQLYCLSRLRVEQ